MNLMNSTKDLKPFMKLLLKSSFHSSGTVVKQYLLDHENIILILSLIIDVFFINDPKKNRIYQTQS
jgi:hypothetical protein